MTASRLLAVFNVLGLERKPLMLINYFIKEIIVFDDEIRIQFHNPLKISPDENQGFFFYDNLVNKPIYKQNGKLAGFNKMRIKMRI